MGWNWNEVKKEYLTTSISYRKLADKYGIPRNTLMCRAKREEWVELRKKAQAEIESKSVQDTVKKVSEYKSTLYDLAYKVARQLDDMTSQNTIADLAAIGIKPRDVTGAIKDLEDALHVKSDTDLREQEARIEKLRKDTQSDTEDNTIKVIISPEAEDFSK